MSRLPLVREKSSLSIRALYECSLSPRENPSFFSGRETASQVDFERLLAGWWALPMAGRLVLEHQRVSAFLNELYKLMVALEQSVAGSASESLNTLRNSQRTTVAARK